MTQNPDVPRASRQRRGQKMTVGHAVTRNKHTGRQQRYKQNHQQSTEQSSPNGRQLGRVSGSQINYKRHGSIGGHLDKGDHDEGQEKTSLPLSRFPETILTEGMYPGTMSGSKHPSWKLWLDGSRPRTWLNAFAPVVAGTGAAAGLGLCRPFYALLALIVSLALIVGVNYANDYSDGIRGTDEDRVGPTRLTASGKIHPQAVKSAAWIAFGIAALSGLALCILSGHLWMILVGCASITAAWFYTGGKHPYGYHGFGEVSVFVFFGLVGVLGTQYVQAGKINWSGVVIAIGVGCYSSAVNLTNNLRDIPTDTVAGKRTLAVILGDGNTRGLHALLMILPTALNIILAFQTPWALLGILSIPLAWTANAPIRQRETGMRLVPALSEIGIAMLTWSLLTAGGLALGYYF